MRSLRIHSKAMVEPVQRSILIKINDLILFPRLHERLSKAASDYEEIEIFREFLEKSLGSTALEYAYGRLLENGNSWTEDEFKNKFRYFMGTSPNVVRLQKDFESLSLKNCCHIFSLAIIELIRVERLKYGP